jgi:hypothetical protein
MATNWANATLSVERVRRPRLKGVDRHLEIRLRHLAR